jgi:hypothetical protein
MSLTDRELWTAIHGMVLGAAFLLAFSGGLAGLYGLRHDWLTHGGLLADLRRLVAGTWIMAILAWLTVIVGTWIVYPWYRAEPPVGEEVDLTQYPRSYLLENPDLAAWHNFGMEWKEHVAWMAPFLATAVAFAVLYYGVQLIRRGDVRNAVIVFFVLAFLAAGAAGLFGAFITKAAPVA